MDGSFGTIPMVPFTHHHNLPSPVGQCEAPGCSSVGKTCLAATPRLSSRLRRTPCIHEFGPWRPALPVAAAASADFSDPVPTRCHAGSEERLRRVRDLPSSAPFRFRLATDTLASPRGSVHHGPQRTSISETQNMAGKQQRPRRCGSGACRSAFNTHVTSSPRNPRRSRLPCRPPRRLCHRSMGSRPPRPRRHRPRAGAA